MPYRGDSAEYALSETQVHKVLASCIDLTDRVIVGLRYHGLQPVKGNEKAGRCLQAR